MNSLVGSTYLLSLSVILESPAPQYSPKKDVFVSGFSSNLVKSKLLNTLLTAVCRRI